MMVVAPIKRWLRRLLLLCAVLFFLLALLAVFAQTPPGKSAIAALTSNLVAEHTRFTLHIDGVAGTLPHRLRVARVEVSDVGGRVVTLHGIEARVALRPLLRGQIHLTELTLDHIEVWRRPTPQERWRIPRPPQLPAWPRVDRLYMARITLDEAVVGVPARLTVTGSVKPQEESAAFFGLPDVALEVRGLDVAGVYGRLNYSMTDGAPLLAVVVEDEQLLPALLDVAPPVSVRLDGAGPRADWRAVLTATTGDAAIAEGAVRLTEGAITSLTAAMEIQLTTLPPLRPYTAMLGDAVTLEATCSLDRSGTLRIAPVSLDSDRVALALRGDVNFEQDMVDLALSLDYADARRLPGMDVLEQETPLRFVVALGGMFTAPEITLAADVDGAQALGGTVRVTVNEVVAAAGNLRVTPPALLRELLPMLPEDNSVDIAFEGSYSEDTGVLDIAAVEAWGMGMEAALRGRITPELPALDVTAALAVDDLSRLGTLLPLPMRGGVRLEFAAVNDGDRLNVTVSADLAALDAAGVQLPRGQIKVKGQGENWFSVAPQNMHGSIEAKADGLQAAGMKPMHLTLSAAVDAPTLDKFWVASLTLTDGNITIAGEGGMNLGESAFKATIQAAVPSIAALPLDMDALPDGTLRLKTELMGWYTPLEFDATLAGQIQAPEGVLAVAGDSITFDMAAVMRESILTLQTLQVSGDTFRVDGGGVFHWNDGALQAEVRAALPDLAAIGEVLDQPLSGALSLAATATGTLPNLKLKARLEGDALAYSTGPPVQAHFDIVADDVPAQSAMTATGQASGGGETLLLELQAALKEDRLLVSPLSVVSGANRISGQAAYLLDTGTPEAQLDADLADLGALAALVGIDMNGRAEATLRLQQDTAEAFAAAHDLEYGEVSLTKMEAQISANGLLDAPTANLSLEMSGLIAGPLNINRIVANGQGNLKDIQLNAAVDGKLTSGDQGSHTLSGDVAGRVSVTERRIEITRLNGNLGAFPVALEAAANARVTDVGFELTPLALRVGEGAVHVEGRQDTASLRGAVRIEAFPLTLTSLVIDPSITGLLNGSIALSGAPDAPEIEAAFDVSEVRFDLEAAEGFTPLQASLGARLAGGRLEVSFAAVMEDMATVNAAGNIPLVLQAQPWLLDIPPAAPVSGNAEWSVSFKPILESLGLVEHYLDASLIGAFALGGTVDAPTASGDAYIRDGHYENALTGTRLRQINVHVHADGPALRLEQFSAETGSRGGITGTGELLLQPPVTSARSHIEFGNAETSAEQFPFTVRIELKDAELAELDYLNGRVNGVILVEGGLGGALVSGDLVVGPVYASMPEQMPASEPTVIEVIEVVDGEIVAPVERAIPQVLPKIKLDIRCDIPGRAYVRAPILDSEWGGNLRVTGLLTEPNVEGRIAVLRGHLDFLGRRFLLRDSAINFLGGAPTDPWLDMRASTETQSISARLNLTGGLSNVKLELTSEPPLPQDEVLSQVLFGRDLSRISPVQAIQLARVAAMFNRGLAGLHLFSGTISLPGIDRIDIRTGERAEETVVGVGRYFTDSVYVEVEQGTTSDSGKISVEVELSPQVSVKGDVDAKERSGVGVFWRRDY